MIGPGVQQSLKGAIHWYTLSANQEDPGAQRNLGGLWAAAQKGSTHSQFNLANMYNMANGVPRDIEKERYWYHKAARQDNVSAQFNLGMIVLERKELPLALYWIRKAAKSGSPKATIFLKPMESSISTNCHSCKAKLVDAPSASRFITVIGTVRSTTGRFTKKIVSTRFWSRLY